MNGKTALEIEREFEYEKHKGKYTFAIVNTHKKEHTMITYFEHIEQALHKVKLDLLTNVNLGLSTSKITIELVEV